MPAGAGLLKSALAACRAAYRRGRSSLPTASEEERLRRVDPWFYSHYVYAASMVTAKLGRYAELSKGELFDFGCGDGIMALGVSRRTSGIVSGFDVTEAFCQLAEKARHTLHLAQLPETLRFMRVNPDAPLPFEDNRFDAGYSWSVFEHVADVEQALAEVHRILKPGAPFFLQIVPFYHSPFGSHLRRLIDEPWSHLLMDEDAYLKRAIEAEDGVPEEEKDLMYRTNEFENVKKYLVGEYRTLNRLRVDELLAQVLKTGFHVREMQTAEVTGYPIPPVLLDGYSQYDLRTNEVLLVISK